MSYRNKAFKEKIELSPYDWLSWDDEKFNEWRRRYDFPRIVDFLFESLPYFSIWLSEQSGLTEKDLIFHGPARFIRFYGEDVNYIEYDASFSLRDGDIQEPRPYYLFLNSDKKNIPEDKIIRNVKFSSYIDWAFINKKWVFPRNIKDWIDIVEFLTPGGITSNSPDYINSDSNIQLNIPLFMPSITIDQIFSSSFKEPPRLELLKLGGNKIEIKDGLIGEKNLEFTNIDNLILIRPIITSNQSFTYATLRNLHIIGTIHAATFHQCTIDMKIEDGKLLECKFEHGETKIDMDNSDMQKTLIKGKRLNLNLKDTDIINCQFKYAEISGEDAKKKEIFNKSAKMIFSHLGYPDLAGGHFFIEQNAKRKGLWEAFADFKKKTGLVQRISYILRYTWMSSQELYWGYGEKPFKIIYFSLLVIGILSSLGYFTPESSTHSELIPSIIFAFQSFTNITIKEIQQSYEPISLLGSLVSFVGVMSVGLLIAALSAKTRNYN